MSAYIDASVLLRIALKESNQLTKIRDFDHYVSSRLLKSECLRTLDRLMVLGKLTESHRLKTAEYLFDAFDYFDFTAVSDSILERVGEPLGLNLGTLDAIHLFSAVSWRQETGKQLVFATHDVALGKAAQLLGFEVLGL